MFLAAGRDADDGAFAIEEMTTGLHASGFGRVGDGRSFSFRVERLELSVEVYRPRLPGPVPQREDVMASVTRSLAHVDVSDERSLTAAVRDAVTTAAAAPRSAR